MENYKAFPIQNTINSEIVINSLNRILEMQKSSGIKFIDTTVMTPAHIVDEMLDALPTEIWSHKTRFLNIACKDGIFLVKIFQRLMEVDKSKFANDTEHAWHILENQLYAICIDETVGNMLKTLIYGVSEIGKEHITWFNTLKDLQLLKGQAIKQYVYNRFVITGNIDRKETIQYMNFDVVIGNPPYNKGMDLDFVHLACKLTNIGNKVETGLREREFTNVHSSLVCMITPAKWQTAEADQRIDSAMTYGEFRKQIVPHMSYVCFYPDSFDIFDIQVKEGISYFVLNKDVKSVCKVENKSLLQSNINNSQLRDITNCESLWNCGNDIVNFLGDYNKFKFGKTDKRYRVYTNKNMSHGGGHLASGGGNTQGTGTGGYFFTLKGNLNCVSKSSIVDSLSKINNKQSFTTITFSSDNKEECESFVSWLNCKFTRFFVMIALGRRDIQFDNFGFRFVPAPPSGKFDHIYTDEELYKAFNLPQKYIDVIEAVIKERK